MSIVLNINKHHNAHKKILSNKINIFLDSYRNGTLQKEEMRNILPVLKRYAMIAESTDSRKWLIEVAKQVELYLLDLT